jgi:hypothetical protein
MGDRRHAKRAIPHRHRGYYRVGGGVDHRDGVVTTVSDIRKRCSADTRHAPHQQDRQQQNPYTQEEGFVPLSIAECSL